MILLHRPLIFLPNLNNLADKWTLFLYNNLCSIWVKSDFTGKKTKMGGGSNSPSIMQLTKHIN